MNNAMYENAIVQKNLAKLKNCGYKVIEPAVGHLACGYNAKGKLPKNEEIVDYVKNILKEKK
jgi:phosphopantothenoylcysteine decarboxylase/phosphopantothenate--cysteine ligase